jgi:hypothetical protein
MNKNQMSFAVVCIAAVGVFAAGAARADMAQMKIYKEAQPGSKIKCVDCHKDAMPKKDDGQHDVNDYGAAAVVAGKAEAEAAKATDTQPTVETYKKIGPVESFKK